jgi:hypothetical protein
LRSACGCPDEALIGRRKCASPDRAADKLQHSRRKHFGFAFIYCLLKAATFGKTVSYPVIFRGRRASLPAGKKTDYWLACIFRHILQNLHFRADLDLKAKAQQ